MASCNDILIDYFCIEPTSPPPTSVVLSLAESAQSTDSTLLLSLLYICLSLLSSSCPWPHLKQEALSMMVVGREEEEDYLVAQLCEVALV